MLGGGISGLVAGWRLKHLCPDAQVTVLEASDRVGGAIKTIVREGVLFEKGPRTFRAAQSPHLIQLIRETGLEKDLIFSDRHAQQRYLWRNGALRSLRSQIIPHLWRLVLEPWIPRGQGEETIDAFATRRFGRALADRLFDPMTLGIYAGDARRLSMEACFPTLVEWERRAGSVIVGAMRHPRSSKQSSDSGSLFTLQGGMQQLPERLASSLEIRLRSRVRALVRQKSAWEVWTDDQMYVADVVFSALPAPLLSALCPEMPVVECAGLSLVNMSFSEQVGSYRGYGYLVPSSEREALLGMIWDSEIFPQQGPGRITAMVRPGYDPETVVLEALQRHLGIHRRPDQMEIEEIDRAIPQWVPGAIQRLKDWEKKMINFYLIGNFIEGVSVENCIARSKNSVDRFIKENSSS